MLYYNMNFGLLLNFIKIEIVIKHDNTTLLLNIHYSFRRRSRTRLAQRSVSRSVTLGTKMYISTYRYRSVVENRLRRTSDLTIISSTIRDE